MLFTTTVSIIAIYFAYISQFKSKNIFFELGFVLLTVIAAIQYNYGTDYMSYYDLWDQQYCSIDIGDFIENFFNQVSWQEPGWILINAIFGFKYGFFILVALISIIENYIYYRLIKEYVPIKWRWFAVFLYVAMDCLYLLNFSMLRQGFTVALFVAAVILLNKKKLWSAVTIMILSLTIHASSAVCIPFLILYFMPLKKTRTLAILLLLLTSLIFIFKNLIMGVLNLMYAFEDIGKYSAYEQKTINGIGLGYLLAHIPNFIILYALFTSSIVLTREQKVVALLAFCDILITPLQFYGAGLAGRLGFYFIAFKVASIPMIYGKIKIPSVQSILFLISFFITLVVYYNFFQTYAGGYQQGYKTILSVL